MRVLYGLLAVLVVSGGLYAILASNDIVPAPGQIACMSEEEDRAATAKAAGHRIVVAQFGNDFFGEYSDRLRQGLDANTALSIAHTCGILPFPGIDRGDGSALKPEHRAALATEGVDAVVWGHRDSNSATVYLLSGVSEEKDGNVYGSVTTFRFRERDAETEPRKFVAQIFGSIARVYGSSGILSATSSKTVYTVLRPLQDLAAGDDGLKDPKARSQLARSFGMAAFHFGREAQDDAVLRDAEQAFLRVLGMPRSRPPYVSAYGHAETVEFRLAQTLYLLGKKEPGTGRLKRSVEKFKSALKTYQRRTRSTARAAIRLELGKAMMSIGAREPGAETYRAAVKVFQVGLQNLRTRPNRSLSARLQYHAGLAQTEVGRHLRSAAELKKARNFISRSLKPVKKSKQPMLWAERTLALARVDFFTDAVLPGKQYFERAEKGITAVQSVWTKADHPERWAEAELARALGEARRGGRAQALKGRKNAVDRLRALIADGPAKTKAPLAYYNLAVLLAAAAERDRDAKKLKEAQQHTERAIELLDGRLDRVAQAMALNNLGYLLELRARFDKDRDVLKQSIEAYGVAEAAYQDLNLDASVVTAGLQRVRRAYARGAPQAK